MNSQGNEARLIQKQSFSNRYFLLPITELAVVFWLSITAILVFALHGFYIKIAAPSLIIPDQIFVEAYLHALAPESEERFISLTVIFATPLICFFISQLVNRIATNLRPGPLTSCLYLFIPVCLVSFALLNLIGSDVVNISLGKSWDASTHVIRWVAVGGTALIFSYFIAHRLGWQTPYFITRIIIVAATAGSSLIQLFSWRVLKSDFATLDPPWYFHFDPLLFALSQVRGGKILLVDFISSYGLYPELIVPFLAASSLSVLTITLFFGALQFASILILTLVMGKYIKSNLIYGLALGALLMTTYGNNLFFAGILEPYYQYYPLRIFWPAMSVYLFYNYLQKNSLVRSTAMSVCAAFGTIWNFDSGSSIAFSFGMFLVYEFITAPKKIAGISRASIFLKILTHIFIFILVIVLVGIHLQLKSNAPLNFGWFFGGATTTHYTLGLYMTPMPLQWHPWILVLTIYAWALIFGFTNQSLKNFSQLKDLLIYLAILGLVLFIYYQGRSQPHNLIMASWPALLIAAIQTDYILTRVFEKKAPLSQLLLPVTVVGLFLILTVCFYQNFYKFTNEFSSRFLTPHQSRNGLIEEEIAFIKTNAQYQKECLLLTRRQGLYQMETHLTSPFKGPGVVELWLKSDQNRLIDGLISKSYRCLFLGIGESSAIENTPDLLQSIFQNYNIVTLNYSKSLLYLIPQGN